MEEAVCRSRGTSSSSQHSTCPTPCHMERLWLSSSDSLASSLTEHSTQLLIPVFHRISTAPSCHRFGRQGQPGCVGFQILTSTLFDSSLSTRLPKTWKPQLLKRQFYSEILDATLTITVTMRTLDLIDAAFGFDFYILKTPKVDLCSKLGMDLKRTMLLRLARRDPKLHPDDPARREAIYDKYKEFVIPEEEAEWVGLSLEEAIEKQRLLEKQDPVPLFKVYAEELVSQLKEQQQAVKIPAADKALGFRGPAA
uniref:Large ribosomal subunit protein bL28m n=1 Tax=Cyanistes caeruleus TaxID=156563 RepID=A0A8C0UJ18_CYACU